MEIIALALVVSGNKCGAYSPYNYLLLVLGKKNINTNQIEIKYRRVSAGSLLKLRITNTPYFLIALNRNISIGIHCSALFLSCSHLNSS